MSIQDQIAQAEAAAANAPENAVATTETTGQSLTTPAASAPVDMSMGAILTAGGLQPDIWLDVKDTGLKLDKNEKMPLQEFKADLDFSKVKMFVGLRVKTGPKSFEYIKSYDGKTEAKSGKPWPVAVQESNARAVEPAEQYRGADILMVLAEDTKQGNVTIPAGKKIGYTTAVTGFGNFQTFLADMITAGDVEVIQDNPFRASGQMTVIASHVEKKNASFTWGVVGFAKA